jgi:hypothetical protein
MTPIDLRGGRGHLVLEGCRSFGFATLLQLECHGPVYEIPNKNSC